MLYRKIKQQGVWGPYRVRKCFGFKYHVREGPTERVTFEQRLERGEEVSHEVTWQKAFRLSRQDVEIPRSVPGVSENSKEAMWCGVRGEKWEFQGQTM